MGLVDLIAVDIDGTLLSSRQQISLRTLAALRTAGSRKIEIVLSSGQNYTRAASIRNMLGFGSHLICSNGALIRTMDGVTIKRESIDPIVSNEVLRVARHLTEHSALTFEEPACPELRDLRTLQGGSATQSLLQITFYGSRIQMQQVLRAITQLPMADRIAISIAHLGDKWVVDVCPVGATKGAALAFLCSHLKIPREKVAAIGDNFNDCGMLEFAGYAFVVGNAPQSMKEKGWRTVPSNDNDGVAYAVESVLASH